MIIFVTNQLSVGKPTCWFFTSQLIVAYLYSFIKQTKSAHTTIKPFFSRRQSQVFPSASFRVVCFICLGKGCCWFEDNQLWCWVLRCDVSSCARPRLSSSMAQLGHELVWFVTKGLGINVVYDCSLKCSYFMWWGDKEKSNDVSNWFCGLGNISWGRKEG